jgi:bud site selection protein 20
MGRTRNARTRTTKNKSYKKQHATKSRKRDIDQIQDDLKKEVDDGKKTDFEIDDDLPGLGQHYCTECAKHFSDERTLQVHKKTKDHKRRLKDTAQKQYTQDEADSAAGRTKEILPPAHAAMKI